MSLEQGMESISPNPHDGRIAFCRDNESDEFQTRLFGPAGYYCRFSDGKLKVKFGISKDIDDGG